MVAPSEANMSTENDGNVDGSIRFRIIQINDVYSLQSFPHFKNLVLHYSNATENIHESLRESLPPPPPRAHETIVVLAGDFLAPYLLSSLDMGRGMVDVMNASGVTHVCFGNHEADVPLAALKERIQQSKFQWLNTNMRELDDTIGCSTPPYDVVEAKSDGGAKKRIALLGLLTEEPRLYFKGSFGDATIDPIMESTASTLKHLEKTHANDGGVDLIVPITHQEVEADVEFAKHFTGNVFPLVVGGHDHDIHNFETPCGSRIVKTGMNAQNAAIIDIVWNDTAALAKQRPQVFVDMIPTTQFPPCPEVQRLAHNHELILEQFEQAKLFLLRAPPVMACEIVPTHVRCSGTAVPNMKKQEIKSDTTDENGAHSLSEQPEPFSTFENRRQPTTGSTVLVSIIRMGMKAQCAVMNAGNIRGGRVYDDPDKEWFTWHDLNTEIPFWNGITTISLPGKVLEDMITYSRRGAHSDPVVERGGYLHTCDMIRYNDETQSIETIRGKPFDPEAEYVTAVPLVQLQGIDNNQPLLDWLAATNNGCSAKIPDDSGRPAKLVIVEFFAALLWLNLGDFASIDTNGDGLLSQAEIKAKAEQVFGIEFANVVVSNLLAVADIDGDGYISADEMIVAQFVATDMMIRICSRNERDLLKRLAAGVLARRASSIIVAQSVENLLRILDQKENGEMDREKAVAALDEHLPCCSCGQELL